jgi:hypothetical protein
MSEMKHVVFFSSGAGSWAAAKRVAAEHGTDSLVLLFADTLIEDEDNYRYLRDAAENVGAPLVIVTEGRTPWEVFKDKRWIGNSRLAQCSHLLKQEPCLKWMRENDPYHMATVYVGIDWSEVNRVDAIARNWSPWKVEAPLTHAPYMTKAQILAWGESEGLKPPRLYEMGFSHANCGGFCVRGGQAHFKNLLDKMPERYAHHESKEQEMREYLGKDQSILTEVVAGEKRSLTLAELRRRAEESNQIDLLDWGGCGCFVDE